MAIVEPNLDDLKWMQLKHEADDAFVEAWENADFWKDSKQLLDWFNMSEFNKDREKQAELQVAKLEAWESTDWEIDWWDAFDNIKTAAGIEEWVLEEASIALWWLQDWKESQEIPENISRWEYNILFQKFEWDGNITAEECKLLQNSQITSENYMSTIDSIDISSKAKTEITACITHLNKSERVDEAKWELHEEFSDVFNDYFTKQDGTINWNSAFHEEAFEKIAQHYMWGNTKTPEERTEDLDMALTMAAEDLWKRAQVSLTSANREFYKKNFDHATDSSISEKLRFDAITNISKVINTVEWVKGKTKQRDQMRVAGERKLREANKYNDFQNELANLIKARNVKNQEQIDKITETLQQMAGDTWLNEWEATSLIGWEVDIMSDTLSENTQESA